MPPIFQIRVDTSEFVQRMEQIEQSMRYALQSAAVSIRERIENITVGLYYNAIAQAGNGFPAIYASHLLRGIQSLRPEVISTDTEIIVRNLDIQGLGDGGDLQEGYHYHAILALDDPKNFAVTNVSLMELPFTGQALYNTDREVRYDFWKAVVDGTDYTVTFGGGKAPTHERTFSTVGLYEETLLARVNWWGNRYPEWMILEYGTSYYPSVPATHFTFFIEQGIREFVEQEFQIIADSIAEVANAPTVTRNSIGQLIDKKSGRYVAYLPESRRRA